MSDLLAVLDGLLVAALLATASLALFGRGLVRGVVLFVAFGLLAAIVWVRLNAPDLALAEAAVGAGITGALLLQGARRLGATGPVRLGPRGAAGAGSTGPHGGGPEDDDVRPGALAAALLAAVGGAVVLGAALLALPLQPGSAAGSALGRLGESAVENPVTAVLLVFRGYDTLLETAVVVAVVLGLRALAFPTESPPAHDPLLDLMVRTLLPAAVVVSGWLLWRGSDAPGGAFQAAAVLAAGLVVARVAGRWPPRLSDGLLRAAFSGGVLAFALVALWGLLSGGSALDWPESGRKAWILGVEAGLTLTLAVLLSALVPGGTLGRRST